MANYMYEFEYRRNLYKIAISKRSPQVRRTGYRRPYTTHLRAGYLRS